MGTRQAVGPRKTWKAWQEFLVDQMWVGEERVKGASQCLLSTGCGGLGWGRLGREWTWH